MRATIASPIYISPLSVKPDRLRQIQDAGFGGYNNPVDLTSNKWGGILPKEWRIGLVLSLGTSLLSSRNLTNDKKMESNIAVSP